MAKGKKNFEENNIETHVTKEEQIPVKETLKEEVNVIPSEETQIEKKEDKKKEIKEKQKYLVFGAETPYTLSPRINSNVAGFIRPGTSYKVEDEIDNGDLGKFWKVDKRKYVNKDFNIQEMYY